MPWDSRYLLSSSLNQSSIIHTAIYGHDFFKSRHHFPGIIQLVANVNLCCWFSCVLVNGKKKMREFSSPSTCLDPRKLVVESRLLALCSHMPVLRPLKLLRLMCLRHGFCLIRSYQYDRSKMTSCVKASCSAPSSSIFGSSRWLPDHHLTYQCRASEGSADFYTVLMPFFLIGDSNSVQSRTLVLIKSVRSTTLFYFCTVLWRCPWRTSKSINQGTRRGSCCAGECRSGNYGQQQAFHFCCANSIEFGLWWGLIRW